MKLFRPSPFFHQAGMALLELAVLSFLAVLLLSGGVLMAERYHHFGEANRMVDRYLHDDAVSPLRLDQLNGNFQVQVNQSEIESYMQLMVESASEELTTYVERFELPGDYLVQMGYRVLEIHQGTGEPVSISSIQCTEGSQQGGVQSGAPCEGLSQSLDVLDQIESESSASIYAVPTLSYLRGDGGSLTQNQFLPFSVIVGLRITFSVQRSNGALASRFNLASRAGDEKVALLRGDIAL